MIIYQFDEQGNRVGEFNSFREIERKLGGDKSRYKQRSENGKIYNGFYYSLDVNFKPVIKEVKDQEYQKPVPSITLSKEQKLAAKIAEVYSISELEQIAKGCRIMPGTNQIPKINFDGDLITFCAAGDLHIGSVYTHDEHIKLMFDECEKEKVDFITLGGDIVEGFSNRDGHVYEQSHIGYNAQKEHSVELLKNKTDVPMYLISGNHDRWYLKSSGADIVSDICKEIPNAEFIGHDEGDINLNDTTTLKLWHGEDGSSYALSYRIQKVIESLSGGTKPGIMLFHHVHKMVYVLDRNIHCISPGSIQMQSKWMRGKRIAAHTGFTIIRIRLNKSGIAECQVTFKPFYA